MLQNSMTKINICRRSLERKEKLHRREFVKHRRVIFRRVFRLVILEGKR